MFVFEFLIWNSFFTGQLALNPFSYYFENFFYITASLVNYQLMLTPKYRWRNFHIPEKYEVVVVHLNSQEKV